MEKTITCASCGGSFRDDLPECPYCGTVNIKGAEKEYMRKLEDVRESLKDLDEAPLNGLQKVIKKQGRKLKAIMLVILAAAVLPAAAAFAVNRSGERDYRAEYLWQQENYPKLNALYDSGEYDELKELYFRLMEDRNAVLYEWEHYDFMSAYIEAGFVTGYLEEEKGKALSDADLASLLECEWRVKGIIQRKDVFTGAEYQAMLPFLEASEADFEARWNMDRADYEDFFEELASHEYFFVSYDKCQEYVKKWIKENR